MNDASKINAFLAHSSIDKVLSKEMFDLMRIDVFAPWLDVECIPAAGLGSLRLVML